MKTNELRIGNLVLIPFSMEGVIIPSIEKQVRGIGTFGGIDFTEPQFPEDLTIPAVHCAGIPLTEEWLLKFGFKIFPWGWVKKSTTDIGLRISHPHFHFERDGENLQQIKYVHQLQNLYFALTGEELAIK